MNLEEVVSDSALLSLSESLDTQNLILAKLTDQSTDLLRWSSLREIIKNGLAPYIFSIGDIIDVCRVTSITGSVSPGSALVNIDVGIFASTEAAYQSSGPLQFTYSSSKWVDASGKSINLNNYGISISSSTAISESSILTINWNSDYVQFQIIGFDNAESDDGYKHSMTLQSYELAQGNNSVLNYTMAIPYCEVPEIALVIEEGIINPSIVGEGQGSYYKFKVHLPDSSTPTYFISGEDFNAGDESISGRHNRLYIDIQNKKCRSVDYSYHVSEPFTLYTSNEVTEQEGYEASDLTKYVDEGIGLTKIFNHSISEQCTVSWNSIDNWYRSNDYENSLIRQWLNASQPSAPNSIHSYWWSCSGHFQILPYPDEEGLSIIGQGSRCAGFLYGLDKKFLDIVGNTNISVYSGEVKQMKDKFYIPSVSELRGVFQNEGTPYNFYILNSKIVSNAPDTSRIRYLSYPNVASHFYYTRSADKCTDYKGSLKDCYVVSKQGEILKRSNNLSDSEVFVCPTCTIYG